MLVLSYMYPNPVDSSAGIFVEEQVRHLARTCNVKVIAPTPWFPPVRLFKRWHEYRLRPVHEHRKGIEILRPRFMSIPGDIFATAGFSYFFSILPVMLNIAKTFDFDIIHAHVTYPDGFAAVLVGKLLKRPVIVTEHTGNFRRVIRKTLGRRALSLHALKNAHLVISVSKNQRRELLQEGLSADKVILIPNGIDLKTFRPMKQETTVKGYRTILFVGHLIENKGVHFLLEALRQLQDRGRNDLQLFLAGDGAWKEYLMEKAQELGLDSKVHFLGVLDKAGVAQWMRKCDLLVLPSLRESFGIVLIEAMACGKPVVATRCGGPEEIVTDDAGILVAPGDTEALSEGIEHVLQNPGRYKSEAIAEHVRLKYDIDRVAERIVEQHQKVCTEFRRQKSAVPQRARETGGHA